MRAFLTGLVVMSVLAVATGFVLDELRQPTVNQSLELKSVRL